jgi:hypothetical protein
MPWGVKKKVVVTPLYKSNLDPERTWVFRVKEEGEVSDYSFSDAVEAELSRKEFIDRLDKKTTIIVGAMNKSSIPYSPA